jgi:hypothetical protein
MMDKAKNNSFKQCIPPLSKALNILLTSADCSPYLENFQD